MQCGTYWYCKYFAFWQQFDTSLDFWLNNNSFLQNLIILNLSSGKAWRHLHKNVTSCTEQHPTKQLLYGHLPPIMKIIQVGRTRHAGHCWRRKNELISDTLRWTSSHGRAKAGQPARTYIQQLYADTGCSLEDFLAAMEDRDGWRKRAMEICAGTEKRTGKKKKQLLKNIFHLNL